MSRIGYLLPGQGSQYIGMGKEFYDTYPEAQAVWKLADKVLQNLYWQDKREVQAVFLNVRKALFYRLYGHFAFVVNLTYLGLSSYIFAIKRG